ncbi:hypothetical protein EVAR_59891_1 [Eumeta japonica]|uniref:Uncharacterized protein n=1 Tax=Eumeta variegata TaxID=151549 RepID=A0A4C2AI02_EUMVA|nr:hypothetical protein EVAR_59891_1 [Eumeta japonica]
MATENSGFCTVVPPTGTRRMHNKNWVSQISPETDPKSKSGLTSKWFSVIFLEPSRRGQPDTAICALSGRSFRAYAGCSATSGTGTSWPRGFHNFPDFSGTGHGKNPEVSRQAPSRALHDALNGGHDRF